MPPSGDLPYDHPAPLPLSSCYPNDAARGIYDGGSRISPLRIAPFPANRRNGPRPIPGWPFLSKVSEKLTVVGNSYTIPKALLSNTFQISAPRKASVFLTLPQRAKLDLVWHGPCFSHVAAKKPQSKMNGNNQNPAVANAPLTINAIQLAIVDSILAQQGEAKSWGQKEHAAAIRKLALSYGLPAERAGEFTAILKENGFGGNSSQFRQWLSKKAQARLPEAKSNLDDYN